MDQKYWFIDLFEMQDIFWDKVGFFLLIVKEFFLWYRVMLRRKNLLNERQKVVSEELIFRREFGCVRLLED